MAIRRGHGLVCLVVLVACIQSIVAFHPGRAFAIEPNRRSFHRLGRVSIPRFTVGEENAIAEATEEETTTAKLVLRTEYSRESEPSPIGSSEMTLDFFRDPKNRNILVSGGDGVLTHAVPPNPALLARWKKRAADLGATEPEATDTIISVQTGAISFPGLRLVSEAIIGAKFLLPADASSFPAYEFVLIDDTREVSGLRPIVWIYNQLTGADKDNETSPVSLSRFTAHRSKDGDSVIFKIDSFLEITIRFPALLLKIIPSSKEKAEERGGAAVRKALSKDIDRAVACFRDAYAASVLSTK